MSIVYINLYYIHLCFSKNTGVNHKVDITRPEITWTRYIIIIDTIINRFLKTLTIYTYNNSVTGKCWKKTMKPFFFNYVNCTHITRRIPICIIQMSQLAILSLMVISYRQPFIVLYLIPSIIFIKYRCNKSF